MVIETRPGQQSQFETLQADSQRYGVDVARLAVDRLTTLDQMREFLYGFATALNLSHDPQREAEFLDQAKEKLRAQAVVARSHADYLKWTVFLNTGSLPAELNISSAPQARQPRR